MIEISQTRVVEFSALPMSAEEVLPRVAFGLEELTNRLATQIPLPATGPDCIDILQYSFRA